MSEDDAPEPTSSLTAEYRRLMRWYPRQWRAANEDAMLGALLDQAHGEGRDTLTRDERAAIRRMGAAQRFGVVRTSRSGWTLAIGGGGIALATLIPLASLLVFMFPLPLEESWLYFVWRPVWTESSACLLVVAFAVLAFGFRREAGIAGASLLGKLGLLLYPISLLALALLSAQLPTLQTSKLMLILIAVGTWTSTVVQFAALIVAAIVVFRAGVVQGLARWGIVVFAILSPLMFGVNYVEIPWVGRLTIWGSLGLLVLRMLVGLIYLASSRLVLGKPRVPMELNRA